MEVEITSQIFEYEDITVEFVNGRIKKYENCTSHVWDTDLIAIAQSNTRIELNPREVVELVVVKKYKTRVN